MLESALTAKMRKRITDRGGYARKMHGGPNSSGLTDIIASYHGWFLGIEVKIPGKEHTLTNLQAATLDAITASGGVARMFTTVAQVDELLDKLDSLHARKKSI
jgi:hypothetical protein